MRLSIAETAIETCRRVIFPTRDGCPVAYLHHIAGTDLIGWRVGMKDHTVKLRALSEALRGRQFPQRLGVGEHIVRHRNRLIPPIIGCAIEHTFVSAVSEFRGWNRTRRNRIGLDFTSWLVGVRLSGTQFLFDVFRAENALLYA